MSLNNKASRKPAMSEGMEKKGGYSPPPVSDVVKPKPTPPSPSALKKDKSSSCDSELCNSACGGNKPPLVLSTELARVSVRLGLTINLGDFQSGRVDVSLEAPCSGGSVEDTYKEVLESSINKLITAANEAKDRVFDKL